MDTQRRQPRASGPERQAAEPPRAALGAPAPGAATGPPPRNRCPPPPASLLPTLEAVRGCKSVATPGMPEEVSLQPGLPSRSCGKPALGLGAGLTAARPGPGGRLPAPSPRVHAAPTAWDAPCRWGGVLRLLLSPPGFPRCCHVRSATAGPWVRGISKHPTVTLFSFQHFPL